MNAVVHVYISRHTELNLTHKLRKIRDNIYKRQMCGLVFSLINGAIPVKQNRIITRHPRSLRPIEAFEKYQPLMKILKPKLFSKLCLKC